MDGGLTAHIPLLLEMKKPRGGEAFSIFMSYKNS